MELAMEDFTMGIIFASGKILISSGTTVALGSPEYDVGATTKRNFVRTGEEQKSVTRY